MSIEFKYRINGAVKLCAESENADYKIKRRAEGNAVKYILEPKKKIELICFKEEIKREFSDSDRVLENGYQSWTDTVEMTKDDRLRRVGRRNKLYLGNPLLNCYGDGEFRTYAREKGAFHSYSYTYIRNGGDYELYGSLTERTGFTIFNIDMRGGTITVEKDLEGVSADSEYEILAYMTVKGAEDEVFDAWFAAMGIAKPRYSRKCGYTSWYNYYQDISAEIIDRDLESLAASGEKIDMFQIDDGFQTAIGDWLSIDKKKFPEGLKPIVDKIHAKGMSAGLWLAPFAAQMTSNILKEHPEYFIKDRKGKAEKLGANWGGYAVLDIDRSDVREHIRRVFDTVLKVWGFDMVKLDFLCSSCYYPRGGKSRGQLMTESMEFLRECVGDKIMLGCGVPLMPCFGLADFCRIGPDMGLSWKDSKYLRMTSREDVTTRYAMCNTVFRRQLNGRAFVNDPDVFLLRDFNIDLDMTQRKIVSTVNNIFGDLLFVSDDVSKYDAEQKAFFSKVMRGGNVKGVSAEMDGDKNLRIVYTEDGEEKKLVFDSVNGELIEGSL